MKSNIRNENIRFVKYPAIDVEHVGGSKRQRYTLQIDFCSVKLGFAMHHGKIAHVDMIFGEEMQLEKVWMRKRLTPRYA